MTRKEFTEIFNSIVPAHAYREKNGAFKTRKELLDKLPLDVHAAIYQRDGYKTVVFDLDSKYFDN